MLIIAHHLIEILEYYYYYLAVFQPKLPVIYSAINSHT